MAQTLYMPPCEAARFGLRPAVTVNRSAARELLSGFATESDIQAMQCFEYRGQIVHVKDDGGEEPHALILLFGNNILD